MTTDSISMFKHLLVAKKTAHGNKVIFSNLWPKCSHRHWLTLGDKTLADKTLNTRWLLPAALTSYLYQLSSEICAGCPRHLKLLFCVSSNFWSGPNSKSTKHILTLFKMPKTVDHYLFIYQKLSLLSSLSNEAKIRLTPWAQPWNCIRSN